MAAASRMSDRSHSICVRISSRLATEPVSRLSMTRTWQSPLASKARTSADPIKPAPPVTTNRVIFDQSVGSIGSPGGDGDHRQAGPGKQAIEVPPDPHGLVEDLEHHFADPFPAQHVAIQPPAHRADLIQVPDVANGKP